MDMDFEAALARIRAVTGTRTQVELANILDIRQSSISDAKRRGCIPATWLVTLYERYGANPTWIKTGELTAYLIPDTDRPAPSGAPLLQAAPVELPAPDPEPTLAELKAAFEARLGDGLRICVVSTGDIITITPAGAVGKGSDTDAAQVAA